MTEFVIKGTAYQVERFLDALTDRYYGWTLENVIKELNKKDGK